MRAFWDERARENAAFFVESRLDYANPDLDVFWAGGEDVVNVFCSDLGLRIEGDVVEIGCGLGRVTRALAARARGVRALDISQEMLDRAEALNPGLGNVEWRLGDGHALTGVQDSSADVVFSHVVFQHLPAPAITYGYVKEMGRVLRPGAWAAFQVSDDPAIHRPPSPLRRALGALRPGPKGAWHPTWLGSAVDLGALRAAAGDAEMDVERITGEGTQFCLVALRRR